MNVPEGAETVHVKGRDLKTAIDGAAEQLGLHPSQVDYKLDLTHFRTPTGVSVARTTVAIVAWRSDRPVSDEPARRPPPPPRPPRERDEGGRDNGVGGEERLADDRGAGGDDRGHRDDRGPRRDRGDRGEGRNGAAGGRGRRGGRDRERSDDRGPRPERAPRAEGDRPPRAEGGSKPDLLRGPEVGTTAASDYAQTWFSRLLELMDVKGQVAGTGSDQRLHLAITADRAGRIVGKRGATLGAIRHLLGLAIEKQFGPLTIDVDVGDDRPREEREAARAEREQSDRGRRGGEGRRGDRGPAPGGDRGPRGGGDREKGRYPPEKLRALARRAAEKAESTGQTITINLELNSFDRRIVHLEVSEMPGVASQSEERVGDDGRVTKFVQIIPVKAEAPST